VGFVEDLADEAWEDYYHHGLQFRFLIAKSVREALRRAQEIARAHEALDVAAEIAALSWPPAE
jgi:hypothetical protein